MDLPPASLPPATLVAHAGSYGGVVTHLNHFSTALVRMLRIEKIFFFSSVDITLNADSTLPSPIVEPELSSLRALKYWPRQFLVPLNFLYELWIGINHIRYFLGRNLVISSHDPNAFWGFVFLSARADYLLHVLPDVVAPEQNRAGLIKRAAIEFWRFFICRMVRQRIAGNKLRLFVPSDHSAAIWATYLQIALSNIRTIPSPSFITRQCKEIIEDSQESNPAATYIAELAARGMRVVLSVGHLESYKNPWKWLELAKFALEIDDGLVFVWAGGGSLYEEIKESAADFPGIYLPGRLNQQDLQRLYQISWIFFHPSNKESQGIVVMDALAFGLPVVLNNCESLPELIRGTDSGFTLDCNAPEACAQFSFILELLRDNARYRKMSKSAFAVVDERYSYEKWLNDLQSLYH
jgi:glycosyltransferase involved in cell wall biosynthesis